MVVCGVANRAGAVDGGMFVAAGGSGVVVVGDTMVVRRTEAEGGGRCVNYASYHIALVWMRTVRIEHRMSEDTRMLIDVY